MPVANTCGACGADAGHTVADTEAHTAEVHPGEQPTYTTTFRPHRRAAGKRIDVMCAACARYCTHTPQGWRHADDGTEPCVPIR